MASTGINGNFFAVVEDFVPSNTSKGPDDLVDPNSVGGRIAINAEPGIEPSITPAIYNLRGVNMKITYAGSKALDTPRLCTAGIGLIYRVCICIVVRVGRSASDGIG